MSIPDTHIPMAETHTVTNQPPPLESYNLYETDTVLREGVHRWDAAWAEPQIRAYGEVLGKPETIALGDAANRYEPELRTHDRYGHRIDEVEFHPAWHEFMRLAMAHEVHNLPWRHPQNGAHVARSCMHSLGTQIESGHSCPITMTFACVPALWHQPDVAAEWEALLLGTEYDPRAVPASKKTAATMGMAMTEKQGGSDVRANSTTAHPLGDTGPGEAYELVGHKWFCSAPMSDAFLTLAYTDHGLTCFLVPRWRPDGTRNPFRIQRLKNKLGNRSNASSEIEYVGTWARMVGEEGRGVRTIIDMVHHTRLDCVSGSSGLMRQAAAQAIHHATHRAAFDKMLIDQPLMRNVLADLALESEAAGTTMLRLAHAYDRGKDDEQERAFSRIATAAAKYWVCKRAPHMIYEAMECLGGAGYVEENLLPRLYREAPVNAIWEGSGNVICLDVLRAMVREPESVPAFLAELGETKGAHPKYDAWVSQLQGELANPEDAEARARRVVEQMALALQASLLLRYAPNVVSDAFCSHRLDDGGLVFGTLAPSTPFREIIDRAAPYAN